MIAAFQNLFAPPRDLILLILAMWAGLALAERRAERHGLSKDPLSNLVFFALVAFVAGGRLGFVLENLAAFSQSPLDVFSPSPSVFDLGAALAAALITAVVYAYRLKLPVWPLLDALTPIFALTAIGLGLSHLASETAYGALTGLPWGIEMRGGVRHASQLYEIIAALLTFGLVWFRKAGPRPGLLFLTFAALTAASRLFLEGFRGDSAYVAGGYRIAQLIAWAVLALCLAVIEYLSIRRHSTP